MDERKIIREEYSKGTPIREIAALLNLSIHAVKSRAQRDPDCPRHPAANGKISTDRSLKGEEMSVQIPTTKDLSALKEHCQEHGLPFDDRLIWWHKTSRFSVCFKDPNLIDPVAAREETIKEMKKYAPKYSKRSTKPQGEHMLVLPMADIHIGKWLTPYETNNTYDIPTAVQNVRESTNSLVEKGKLFGVTSYVVVIGNDMLHIDTPKRTSTAGTPQDTHGNIQDMFRAAKKLLVALIEQLAVDADVHLIHVPSNHDWLLGFGLADAVGSWFNNHPNVHCNDQSLSEVHRKYVVFGNNLVMFTHGDGAKEKDLHWHLATEAAEVWSKTKFRYVYAGHIHHKVRKVKGRTDQQTEKDLIGFTEIKAPNQDPVGNVYIEYVRSPSPPDGWHHRNGYCNQQATEAFLHHEENGQVARFTHFF